jgi:cysteine desulfurase
MRPEAVEAMLPFLVDHPGNPSGGHAVAREAKTALEEARERVAGLLGRAPSEIVFTGGGTEADNLAVKGVARSNAGALVVSAFEHKGVLAPARRLGQEGRSVHEIPVRPDGLVDLGALETLLDGSTALVSVMAVNNEIGTVQPVTEIAALVHERAPRSVFHTDAVQAVPWLDVASVTSPCDLVSISAHKFGGPKGVGVLVVREGVRIAAEIEGGGQERGLRSGTVNVAGAVALAEALSVTVARRQEDVARVAVLRDRLADGLAAAIPDAFVNGDPAHKVAGSLHVGFPGVESEALLLMLDQRGVCAAAGSSCSSGATEPSHVLEAIGLSRTDALASIRLSLGYSSTDADVDHALEVIPDAVARLRRAQAVA